jgi:signal transduction histidine kinase
LGFPWVSALTPDANGALWVGTYGGGLYRLDPEGDSFTPYRHDPANPRSLSDDTITDLHMDRAGVLWVGTRGGGLNRFDRAGGTFTVSPLDSANPATPSNDWVWAIAEDASGNLWIGTFGGGLSRLDPVTGRATRYRHDPRDLMSLTDDNIWALHVDRANVLWIGTFGGGLDRFDRATGTFAHLREKDGLSSDRVISILEDGGAGDPTGNLWITTGRWLSKLQRDRKTFNTYGTTHGLPLTEYYRGGQALRSGELLLSSNDGLVAFYPDEIRKDEESPQVVFTKLLVANKPALIGDRSPLREPINQARTIELSHADRAISFQFAALDYRDPKHTRYRYRLEGFDANWIEVDSTQRLVTYTSLAPRTYTFHVTAANANGVWNNAARAITVIVAPPWWATWWFRGLMLMSVAGCLTGAYLWRVGRLERRRRVLEAEIAERKQIEEALRASNRRIQDLAGRLISAQEGERARLARELHDDVNQQLGALCIALSNLKRRLPPRPPADLAEIASLQEQARAASETIRGLSHQLHPSVIELVGLVPALGTICAEFAKLKKIDIAFHADEGLENIPLEPALCLYRVAQEALRNATRHSNASRAEVALRCGDDGTLELSIADNGCGFNVTDAQRRTGLGLVSIDERVRLVGGRVQVQSRPGHGTELRVWVPVDGSSVCPTEEDSPSEAAGGNAAESYPSSRGTQ